MYRINLKLQELEESNKSIEYAKKGIKGDADLTDIVDFEVLKTEKEFYDYIYDSNNM